MTVGDLKTEKGVADLNSYLSERSYIEGWQASQADVAVFEVLDKAPASTNIHALRWYNHIKSYNHKTLPGLKTLAVFDKHTAETMSVRLENVDDNDVDLFCSDEEDDAEAATIRKERLKAYAEKKLKRPAVIAKSSVVIDVKPWDDETNMNEMERVVRSLEIDGLVWGASKFVPVGYGIKKLQIMCVVIDEKVSVDGLLEQIQGFEDLVQSVDIATFNKI